MRTHGLAVAVVALLGVSAWAQDPQKEEANKKDMQRMLGSWRYASLNDQGSQVPPQQFAGNKLTFKEKQDIQFDERGGNTSPGKFEIDATTNPKMINIVFVNGPHQGEAWVGIYEIGRKEIKLGLSTPGGARPTDFTIGAGHIVIRLAEVR